jgi:D-alanyl-D-alanine-carboxypeptidase/D-alanyl-D-alanine-endopeptidase
VQKPQAGGEITLLDLSAQRSGLPRMPDNFHPADLSNPYVDYDEKALFAFLGTQGVARRPDARFLYSNLGVGLLGVALARRAGVSYEALLHRQITGPLGMRETVITLPPALERRFAEGHDEKGKPAHRWDQSAFAGAGAIRSTAADMLVYLEAQLHPERLPASAAATPEGRTLAAAIRASHVARGEMGQADIALAWGIGRRSHAYFHDGATGGYSAYAAFDPARDHGVIVLANISDDDDLADTLGEYVLERLNGEPAVSLAPPR